MSADLKQQIREFIAEVNDPASLTTTREHLAKAVGLLMEAGDKIDKLLVKAINNEGMADCMDMVYSDLKRAGIVSDSVPPMMLAEAIIRHIHNNSVKEREALRELALCARKLRHSAEQGNQRRRNLEQIDAAIKSAERLANAK